MRTRGRGSRPQRKDKTFVSLPTEWIRIFIPPANIIRVVGAWYSIVFLIPELISANFVAWRYAVDRKKLEVLRWKSWFDIHFLKISQDRKYILLDLKYSWPARRNISQIKLCFSSKEDASGGFDLCVCQPWDRVRKSTNCHLTLLLFLLIMSRNVGLMIRWESSKSAFRFFLSANT